MLGPAGSAVVRVVAVWITLGVVAAAQGAEKAPSPSVPAATPALLAPIADGDFVRVQGDRFVVAGLPFRFVGANFDPLHGEDTRERYKETLAALASDGLRVGRIWALGEGGKDASEWSRKYEVFRAGPDDFIEESFRQLDRVLVEARRLGVRLIITLSNNWKDYGGIPTYLTWAGLPTTGLPAEAFYSDEKTRFYFMKHLLKLVTRTNSLTGRAYRDDPTIFAWELMNESVVVTPAGRRARLDWVRDMARLLKAHDPNHLVAAGLLGYRTRVERLAFLAIHRLPEVDYCDLHLYLQNGEVPPSVALMNDVLDDGAQLSRFVLGKPLLIGEFGFRTDGERLYLKKPRADWFRMLLTRHFQNGGAGALVWLYEPFQKKPRDFGIYTDRADTADVRAALRQAAARLLLGPAFPQNPRLKPEGGDGLLYEPLMTLSGRPTVYTAWRSPAPGQHDLAIPPEGFARARFERAGTWRGGTVAHAYGADAGEFAYRFAAPPGPLPPLAAIEIDARLSSEWPGAEAPRDGGSTVLIRIDGIEVGRTDAPADDGIGARRRIRITDPRQLLRLQRGVHTLSFVVLPTEDAHGLCLYGDYLGKPPLPPGEFGPIVVRYLAAAHK